MLLFIGVFALSWIVAGQLVAAANHPIQPPPKDLPAVNITLPSRSGSLLSGWLIDGAAHVDLYQFAGNEYESRVLGYFEENL